MFIPYIVPAAIILLVILVLYHIFGERIRNNASTSKTAKAIIIARRSDVSGMSGDADTSSYVTFQLADGRRIEFNVRGSEYGLLVEGDSGSLSYQGTRYKGFYIS